jgi:hypothetical protein
MTYNYASFPLDMEQETFDAFPDRLRTGDRAPDGTLVDATTGEEIALSSLWRSRPLVIEFGSFT